MNGTISRSPFKTLQAPRDMFRRCGLSAAVADQRIFWQCRQERIVVQSEKECKSVNGPLKMAQGIIRPVNETSQFGDGSCAPGMVIGFWRRTTAVARCYVYLPLQTPRERNSCVGEELSAFLFWESQEETAASSGSLDLRHHFNSWLSSVISIPAITMNLQLSISRGSSSSGNWQETRQYWQS